VTKVPAGPPNLDEELRRKLIKPPPKDSRVEKWKRWHDLIDKDLTDIFGNREVWRAVNKIIDDNPALPSSHFFEFQALNYATTQAIAVRRQADIGGQVVTLGRLLAEVHVSPKLLTRDRYVSMFEWGMQWIGSKQFDGFAGDGGQHVDPATVAADQALLSEQSESIRKYVDKHLAHFEKPKAGATVPTFDDLDAAIGTLGELFRKYGVLLTATDRAVMAPVPQYDWLAPFRVPWIPQ
jgi:hypothetical protein